MSDARVQQILDEFPNAKRDALIPILQRVQETCGYLSKDAIVTIGERLNLPASKIFGVATFYNQFRFAPLGEKHIQVCRGTACHVKGSANVMQRFCHELGIGDGETTKDGKFSLEVVSCIGACGLAPVITVNGEFVAKVTEDDVPDILRRYDAAEGGDDKPAAPKKKRNKAATTNKKKN